MKKSICFICFCICCQVFGSRLPLVDNKPDTAQPKTAPLNIVNDILDNSKCQKGVVYRPFEEGEGTIQGIVLHYTVCQTYEATKSAYYNAGVSAHSTVDFNGTIYQNVSEECIAFHAGTSAYDGKIALNRFYLGIEQVHPGYKELNKAYTGEWNPDTMTMIWPGDDRKWFKFPEVQYESTGNLVRRLQIQHRIFGRFVVTHADIAPSRKVDAGPMFPYRLIFEKLHAGYFPSFDEDKFDKYHPLLSSLQYEDYCSLLAIYGYEFKLPKLYQEDYEARQIAYEAAKAADFEKDKDGKEEPQMPKNPCSSKQEGYDIHVLNAFRLHFCSDAETLTKLSPFGTVSKLGSKGLTDLEKVVILGLTVGYYHYYDENLGYDDQYRERLQQFMQDPKQASRMAPLGELLSGSTDA